MLIPNIDKGKRMYYILDIYLFYFRNREMPRSLRKSRT